MSDLKNEIAAYEKRQKELEEKHMGKWVLFHDGELVNIYDSFDDAATEAVTKFGRGPYLLRQIGAPSITLPASVMFGITYA
jgi:hypothetical protein